MSREQSDQVALAVDYPARPNPFDNVVFMKNAIASGSIVPPTGESRNVRRQDFIVGCVVCLFVAAGIAAFALSMMIGRH